MKTLTIIGRMGQEPELKQAGNTSVLQISVAVDDQKKARDGSYEKLTLWVRVVVFGKRAESLAKVLQKGMRVGASGEMKVDQYTDKNGEKRFAVVVIANDIEPLFDKRPEGGTSERRPAQHRETSAGDAGAGGDNWGGDDRDIPF
jgi:single-strand DNA-binding protein